MYSQTKAGFSTLLDDHKSADGDDSYPGVHIPGGKVIFVIRHFFNF